jgi:tetracycline repressor-like protein
VLAHGQQEFVEVVLKPALQKPRGVPRLRAMFVSWLDWTESAELPGGCPMIGGAAEFDDKPGPVRDMLASGQRAWIDTLKRAVRQAIDEKQLPASTDPEQIAFEMFGIALVVHHHRRLLGYPKARARALDALERLIS